MSHCLYFTLRHCKKRRSCHAGAVNSTYMTLFQHGWKEWWKLPGTDDDRWTQTWTQRRWTPRSQDSAAEHHEAEPPTTAHPPSATKIWNWILFVQLQKTFLCKNKDLTGPNHRLLTCYPSDVQYWLNYYAKTQEARFSNSTFVAWFG